MQLLEARWASAVEIAEAVGVTRRQANRIINDLSVVLPVQECGGRYRIKKP
jgi:plasmid maintenance system antidote protein VapI